MLKTLPCRTLQCLHYLIFGSSFLKSLASTNFSNSCKLDRFVLASIRTLSLLASPVLVPPLKHTTAKKSALATTEWEMILRCLLQTANDLSHPDASVPEDRIVVYTHPVHHVLHSIMVSRLNSVLHTHKTHTQVQIFELLSSERLTHTSFTQVGLSWRLKDAVRKPPRSTSRCFHRSELSICYQLTVCQWCHGPPYPAGSAHSKLRKSEMACFDK